MSLLRHGDRKYPEAAVKTSSARLGWRGIAAEIRRHAPSTVAPQRTRHMEFALILRRARGAFVSRKGAGIRQDLVVEPGRLWLCPVGVDVEYIRFEGSMDILHFYLAPDTFDRLSDAQGGQAVSARQIRYLAGVDDALVRQIGGAFLAEMEAETAGGAMLIETLALSLAARLVQRYGEAGPRPDRLGTGHRLSPARLRRVLDYMAAHLEERVTVDDLARVACLSPFHFIRMFRESTGVPPCRYLGRLRLERAKALLASGQVCLQQVADATGFSTASNFGRAFRRATGLSPGAYGRLGGEP